jgi:hypothetical protein
MNTSSSKHVAVPPFAKVPLAASRTGEGLETTSRHYKEKYPAKRQDECEVQAEKEACRRHAQDEPERHIAQKRK